MRVKSGTLGLMMALAATSAHAQERPSFAARFASAVVALDGKVTAAPVDAAPAQIVGNGSRALNTAKHPCGVGIAISADAARDLIRRIAGEEGFDVEFALAVANVESKFDSAALSPKGAVGLMQLMPDTAADLKVDLCRPDENVRGGVRHLKALHAKYKNPIIVLAAYNAGEGVVIAHGGLPPYRETLGYVAKVLNALNGWPELSRPSDHRARPRAASPVDSDRAQSAEPTSDRTRSAPTPQWKSGFVMNLD